MKMNSVLYRFEDLLLRSWLDSTKRWNKTSPLLNANKTSLGTELIYVLCIFFLGFRCLELQFLLCAFENKKCGKTKRLQFSQ